MTTTSPAPGQIPVGNDRPTPIDPPPGVKPMQNTPPPPPATKGRVWIIISSIGAFLLVTNLSSITWSHCSSLSLTTFAVLAWLHGSSKEIATRGNRVEVGNNGQKGAKDGDNKLQMDKEFKKLAGPRKFSYSELAMATDDFAEGRLLRQGGSGKVYVGYLNGMENKVAIKKITAESKLGRRSMLQR